jgi:hypothetical protein
MAQVKGFQRDTCHLNNGNERATLREKMKGCGRRPRSRRLRMTPIAACKSWKQHPFSSLAVSRYLQTMKERAMFGTTTSRDARVWEGL